MSKVFVKIVVVFMCGICLSEGMAQFVDHGTAVNISESRGSLLARDSGGTPYLLIALRDILPGKGSRGSLVLIDLETGKSTHHFFGKDEEANGDSYCLFVSKAGKLYLSCSSSLYEFDLASKKILKTFTDLSGPAMSMGEDAEGNIYLALYPEAELLRYTPSTQKLDKLTKLDPDEKYPTSMGVDSKGWVYVGLGTVRSTLVAYHPASGERRLLSEEKDRMHGTAAVYQVNGKVFATLRPGGRRMRLSDGKATPAKNFISSEQWQREDSMYWLYKRWRNADGWQVQSLSLENRTLQWINPQGESKGGTFDYRTEGAEISSLTAAANGKIYGSSAHPMRIWSFNPKMEQLKVEGAIPRVGGGNLPKVVPWKQKVVGNAYAMGDFYAYDPAMPIVSEEDSTVNPVLIASSSPLVRRPRGLLAHPDGKHIISTGFPGYGEVGGGMLIVDMEQQTPVALLSADQLVPNQSITALTALPNGNLIGGTTINTPGGARPIAKEAVLMEFDFAEKKTLWTKVPVGGVSLVNSLTTLGDGNVAGITSDGVFFVFNPVERKTIRREQIEHFEGVAGSRGDTSFVKTEDGGLLLVLSKIIYDVSPDGRELTPILESPVHIHNVGTILNHRLYFSSGSHLWSVRLPKK